LVQNLLKSRITVYQFLQTSNENTAQVVKNNFENFINEISHLKTLLVTQENKKASDTIVTLSNEYLVAFDKLAQYKIEEAKNSGTAQSVEIKSLISTMVQLGSEIDEKLHHISEKASQDRDEAFTTLSINLLVIALIATALFILLSFIITRGLLSTITSFQKGLFSFLVI